MAAKRETAPHVCRKCPQFSNGTCLVLSVNVRKYGQPTECKRI